MSPEYSENEIKFVARFFPGATIDGNRVIDPEDGLVAEIVRDKECSRRRVEHDFVTDYPSLFVFPEEPTVTTIGATDATYTNPD